MNDRLSVAGSSSKAGSAGHSSGSGTNPSPVHPLNEVDSRIDVLEVYQRSNPVSSKTGGATLDVLMASLMH